MSAKPLAEIYEELKERRRRGESDDEIRQFVQPLGGLVAEFAGQGRLADLGRYLEIKTLADRVFGDGEKADAWLLRPNASLSNQRPVELLKDELGAPVIREMLERIDHGIFA
jgi:Protein of unknown function (DUF2384)